MSSPPELSNGAARGGHHCHNEASKAPWLHRPKSHSFGSSATGGPTLAKPNPLNPAVEQRVPLIPPKTRGAARRKALSSPPTRNLAASTEDLSAPLWSTVDRSGAYPSRESAGTTRWTMAQSAGAP
jgi:hypothetical protein